MYAWCVPGKDAKRASASMTRKVRTDQKHPRHLHKEAADKLQKQLQEMADEEKLNDGMGRINITDQISEDPGKISADIESIASSAASMAFKEARAEVKRLKIEMYVMKIQEQAKSKTQRPLTQKEIVHNNITGSPVVVSAVKTMDNMDVCTLWWVVQWVNEYLARFKHSATGDAIDELEAYKKWTQTQKAKANAGFHHTTASSAKTTPNKATPFVDSD